MYCDIDSKIHSRYGFKIGDLVKTNSEGPLMFVIGDSPNRRVWVEYRMGDYIKEEAIPAESLKKIDFRVGDKVTMLGQPKELPPMEVVGISHNARVWVENHCKDGSIQEFSIVPEALVLFERAKPLV